MSLWIRRRGKSGQTDYVLIGLPWVLLPTVLMACALHLVLAHLIPTIVAGTALLSAGFLLFATAKLSLIRSGTLISFGTAAMTSGMRACYRIGYSLMVTAAVLILLAIAMAG